MSDLVDPAVIEQLVGRERHPNCHYARWVTGEDTIYVLHSTRCLTSGRDLRECRLSKALDRGTVDRWWEGLADRCVPVGVLAGLLAPLTVPEVDRDA